MKTAIVTALILLVVFIIPAASAQESTEMTIHVQDDYHDPINHATVTWIDHSASLTDVQGNVVFNVFDDNWPIIIQAEATGYDISPLRTYERGTLYGDDPSTEYHIITIFPSFGPGENINQSANSCCGATLMVVSFISTGFIFVSYYSRKPEDQEEI